MYISSLSEESLTIGSSMQKLTLQPGMLCMALLSKTSHVDALRLAFLGVVLVEVVDNVIPLAVSQTGLWAVSHCCAALRGRLGRVSEIHFIKKMYNSIPAALTSKTY